jgi:phthiodiolone/phenolphthiodiolone dimycocerosates ketoreductase
MPATDMSAAVTVGAPGNSIPPFERMLHAVGSAERNGFDAIWWSDHWMGWFPDGVWDPKHFDIATRQSSPHVYLDAMVAIAAAACRSSSVMLGTAVSDPIRRHPVALATEALSLQHLSKGRFILGLGAGEGENIEPYGLDFSKPVSRLQEALEIIRLLWTNHHPIDYTGQHFKLHDAVLGLQAPDEGPPPIWLAAHGNRMLRITGEIADGWIPMTVAVDVYRDRLQRIRAAQASAGRPADAVTPGLWSYVIVAPTRSEAEAIVNHPLMRGLTFLLGNDRFEKYGASHPLEQVKYGLMDYIPTRVSGDEYFKAAAAVPAELLDEFFLWGTPDDLVERTLAYVDAGCRHPIWWNISFLTDLSQTGPSFRLLAEARADLRRRLRAGVPISS